MHKLNYRLLDKKSIFFLIGNNLKYNDTDGLSEQYTMQT